MNNYVIDASVAAKWYFPEVWHEEAKRYLSPRFHQLAPDFLRVEFTNVLFKKEKSGDIDASHSDAFLRHFLQNVPIEYFPAGDLLLDPQRMAREIRHPVYDCLYLALAERETAVVVTADRQFHDRVKLSRFAPLITLLDVFPVEE